MGRGVRSENSCVQAGVTTYASRLRTGNQSFVSKTVTLTATPAIQTSRSGRIINTVLPSSTAVERGRGSIIPVYYEGVEDDDDMSDEKETTDIPDVSSATEEDQDADSTAAPPADTIQRKAAQLTRHPLRTEAQIKGAFEEPDVLIPIRLDLDLDTFKIKDAFTWNMNEELVTPDIFAQIMCTDLDIPISIFAPQIAASIRTQIEEYAPVAEIQLPENSDLNVIVNLSLSFPKQSFRDTFEWDLTSTWTPENFAAGLCADLALAGEYHPIISHAIHENTLRLKKEACEGGLSGVPDNFAAFGDAAGIRIDQDDYGWAPMLEYLSREEIERRDGDRDRQLRRVRRETARFGSSAVVGGLAGDYRDSSTGGGRRSRRRSASPSPGRGESPHMRAADTTTASARSLTDIERPRWLCTHCYVRGTSTPFVRRGPQGNKALCQWCGVYYAKYGVLPEHRYRLCVGDPKSG